VRDSGGVDLEAGFSLGPQQVDGWPLDFGAIEPLRVFATSNRKPPLTISPCRPQGRQRAQPRRQVSKNLITFCALIRQAQDCEKIRKMSLIAFHAPEPPAQPVGQGEVLYHLYREERIRQGWEEFKWESLSETQQIVWHRVAERIG